MATELPPLPLSQYPSVTDWPVNGAVSTQSLQSVLLNCSNLERKEERKECSINQMASDSLQWFLLETPTLSLVFVWVFCFDFLSFFLSLIWAGRRCCLSGEFYFCFCLFLFLFFFFFVCFIWQANETARVGWSFVAVQCSFLFCFSFWFLL